MNGLREQKEVKMKKIDWSKSIRNYRDYKMLNQEDLAEALNTTQPSVSCWETARVVPLKSRQQQLVALPGWENCVAYMEVD